MEPLLSKSRLDPVGGMHHASFADSFLLVVRAFAVSDDATTFFREGNERQCADGGFLSNECAAPLQGDFAAGGFDIADVGE